MDDGTLKDLKDRGRRFDSVNCIISTISVKKDSVKIISHEDRSYMIGIRHER